MKGTEQSGLPSLEYTRLSTRVLVKLILAIFLTAAVISCSNEGVQDQNAPNDGEKLFKQSVIGGNAGCATCHSLEEGIILIGPSLAGIGKTSSQRNPGKSAEEYIRESILKPNAFVLEGFPAGVMPGSYAEDISEIELNLIVDFLLALR